MKRRSRACRRTRARRRTRRRSSSSAAGRIASVRVSSSITLRSRTFRAASAGYQSIVINCNPETVSTDFDTADRLYFEPLTAEDVLEIIAKDRTNGTLHGVIMQFGGQTAMKLARALEAADVPILGASPDAIDLAEDRDRFKRVLDKLRLKQPKNGIAYSVEQARLVAADLGLPLVVRPSYVLGGRAMKIIRETTSSTTTCSAPCPSWCRPTSRRATQRQDRADQHRARQKPAAVRPLPFRRHRNRRRLPVRRQRHLHRRHHGAHRGSRHQLRQLPCSLPPHSLMPRYRRTRTADRELALGLNVVGLMNVQYAIKDGDDLRARGQPAGVAHRAVRRQGGRDAGREDRRDESWPARRWPSSS